MQAATLEMSGISLLQSRKASPVHICWASAVNAKLDVDVPVTEMASAAYPVQLCSLNSLMRRRGQRRSGLYPVEISNPSRIFTERAPIAISPTVDERSSAVGT